MTGLEHIPGLLCQATEEINRLRAQRDRLAEALRACQESLRCIADGAGDVPDWNEGGEYYEAEHKARSALDSLNPTAPST